MSELVPIPRCSVAPALLCVLLLAAAAGLAAIPGPPGALLSQVRGQVTLAAATDASAPPARPLQQVAPGATLRLARGAEVLVICADDRAVRLTGPVDWRPGADACAAGRALPAGTYQRLVPARGQVRSFHGSLLEEAPSRSDDEEGKVPVLLNPRSPQRGSAQIFDAAPAISWSAVFGALEYELAIERKNPEPPARLMAARVKCGEDRRTRPLRACTAAWPWAPLAADEEIRLQVHAHTSDPQRPRRSADPSSLRLAPAGVRQQVAARLQELEASELPPATRELLRADLLAEANLPNETATALAAVLEAQPQAIAAARLADLYLGLGLLRGAQNHYGQAQQMLPPRGGETEVRAAVHLGLGRLYTRRKDPQFTLAADHLQRAAELYRGLGWTAEATTTVAEAERARRNVQ